MVDEQEAARHGSLGTDNSSIRRAEGSSVSRMVRSIAEGQLVPAVRSVTRSDACSRTSIASDSPRHGTGVARRRRRSARRRWGRAPASHHGTPRAIPARCHRSSRLAGRERRLPVVGRRTFAPPGRRTATISAPRTGSTSTSDPAALRWISAACRSVTRGAERSRDVGVVERRTRNPASMRVTSLPVQVRGVEPVRASTECDVRRRDEVEPPSPRRRRSAHSCPRRRPHRVESSNEQPPVIDEGEPIRTSLGMTTSFGPSAPPSLRSACAR